MKKLLAYCDEFGNNSFDFSKEGTHFIVTSVIIDANKKDEIARSVVEIKKKLNIQGELKSQNIGKDNNRRTRILVELLKLDFTIYAVVVDKQKLDGDGFKYKKSFYKFLNGLVYQELFKVYPNLDIEVDEHGSNKFMLEFKKYVEVNHRPNLFSGSEFSFASSTNSILIQVADFIAGTLGRCFDHSKKDSHASIFLEMLKPSLSSINHFPKEKGDLIHPNTYELNAYDKQILNLARNNAYIFLEKKEARTQEYIDQVNFVKLLLLYVNTFRLDTYISTTEIIRHLEVGREGNIDKLHFRSNVVAKLRDKGLLIASSTSKGKYKGGYKLPTKASDLLDFIDHGNVTIIPMLSRIRRCRDMVKLATQNGLDLLDNTTYLELKKILDKI